MKRYLVFGIDYYYPGGGWSDYKKDFDDLQKAISFGYDLAEDSFEVIDTETEYYAHRDTTIAYDKRQEYSKKKWER